MTFALLIAGAVALLLFIVFYMALSPWWLTFQGRALLAQKFVLLAMIAFFSLDEFMAIPHRQMVLNLCLLAWVTVAWLMVIGLRVAQRPTLKVRADSEVVRMDEREILPGNEGVPTQVANPGRATKRTAAAVVVGVLLALPVVNSVLLIVQEELQGQAEFVIPGWVWIVLNASIAAIGIVTSVVTRILAIPAVNDWVSRHLPGLAPFRSDGGR